MAGHQSVHAEAVPPLSPEEKETLLAHLLLSPALFLLAKDRVSADCFDGAGEAPYRVLWTAVQLVCKELGQQALFAAPGKVRLLVETYCARVLQARPDMLVPEARHLLVGDSPSSLCGYLYGAVDPAHLSPEWAPVALEHLLKEQIHRKVQRLFGAGKMMSDLSQTLQGLHEQALSTNLSTDDPFEEPAPADWKPKKLGIRSTGFPALDALMRGGDAPQEVYGIVGCTGVGKTTLILQLIVNGAQAEQGRYEEAVARGEHYDLGYYFLFHYEAEREEMRRRLMSCAADVSKNSLEDYDEHAMPLSTTGHLKEYEKERFADKLANGDEVPGETERMQTASLRVNKNIILVDMSSSVANPRRGSGGIAEIGTMLAQAKQARGIKRVCTVGLDHASAITERFCEATGRNEQFHTRTMLSSMADQCHRHIAVPHDCSVWIMHHFKGEAEKMSPHKVLNHSDAAESKSFAKNLWFAFTMGTRHHESGCLLLHRSKSRRAGIDAGERPTRLIRLDGAFGKFVDTTGRWVYKSGVIVQSHEAGQTAASDEDAKSKLQQGKPKPPKPPKAAPGVAADDPADDVLDESEFMGKDE